MVAVIRVEPMAGGWALRQSAVANPQVFVSGAKAEDAALRLGARLAAAGDSAEIRIYLRDGALGGRFVCPAADLTVAPEAISEAMAPMRTPPPIL